MFFSQEPNVELTAEGALLCSVHNLSLTKRSSVDTAFHEMQYLINWEECDTDVSLYISCIHAQCANTIPCRQRNDTQYQGVLRLHFQETR
jgi:hypothetical protein